VRTDLWDVRNRTYVIIVFVVRPTVLRGSRGAKSINDGSSCAARKSGVETKDGPLVGVASGRVRVIGARIRERENKRESVVKVGGRSRAVAQDPGSH